MACTDYQAMQFFSYQVMLQEPYQMSTLIVAFPLEFATNDNNKVTYQLHIHANHMSYPINLRRPLILAHYSLLSFSEVPHGWKIRGVRLSQNNRLYNIVYVLKIDHKKFMRWIDIDLTLKSIWPHHWAKCKKICVVVQSELKAHPI